MTLLVFAVLKSAWDTHVLSASWCSAQGHPNKDTKSFAGASCLWACFATLNFTAPNVLLSFSYSSLLFLIMSPGSEGLWTWCNEFPLFRGSFSCNHIWSKCFNSAALICTLVFSAQLKRTKFSPQLEKENSQILLMNFKLLFTASISSSQRKLGNKFE